MSQVVFIKKIKSGLNLQKFKLGLISSSLLLSGCSGMSYDLSNYGNESINVPYICVQVKNECRPLLSLNTVNNFNNSSVSGRYYTEYPNNNDILVNFDVNGDEGFDMVKSLKDSNNQYSLEIINKIDEFNVSNSVNEMQSAHVFKLSHEGEELFGIKFNKGSKDYDDFKVKFSRSRSLTENFDMFIALHELFHFDKKMDNEIIPSTNEFFSDVASVVSLSVENNYSYQTFTRVANELRDVRRADAEKRRSYRHYGTDKWRDLSDILPSKTEYDAIKLIHQENTNDLIQEVIDSHTNKDGIFEIKEDFFEKRDSTMELVSNLIYKKMSDKKHIRKRFN